MQHLESIVIHWTRQIKDVVNNHDNALSAEILGPLEEIEVGDNTFIPAVGQKESSDHCAPARESTGTRGTARARQQPPLRAARQDTSPTCDRSSSVCHT